MGRVLDFKSFSFINENESYQVPDLKNLWDGGYLITPLDLSDADSEFPQDRIIISKSNEKSICLCFNNHNGNEATEIWIPKDACIIKTGKNGQIEEIKIDPYKKWIADPSNKSKLEDFAEDFADNIEFSKKYGSEKIKRDAQDDVELLMDILSIPGNIESFDGYDDYVWDARLDNGMIIEITKRSPDDLLSKFKIYLKDSDNKPCVYINNSSDKKLVFNLPEIGEINMDGDIESVQSGDPYIKYLFRRSTDTHSESDKESLVNYFRKFASEGNDDREKAKMIRSLLSEFLDKKDIEQIEEGTYVL